MVALAMVAALLAGTALFLRSRGHAEICPRERLPRFPRGWETGKEERFHSAAGARRSRAGEFLERNYSRTPDEPSVDFFLAYFSQQRMGSTMHSPQNCLPGSGWTPVEFARVDLTRPGAGQHQS